MHEERQVSIFLLNSYDGLHGLQIMTHTLASFFSFVISLFLVLWARFNLLRRIEIQCM